MKHVQRAPRAAAIKSKLRTPAKGMKPPTRTYEAGEVLIRQGARATDEVFLIKKGVVDIIVKDKDTGEDVKVATREAGEFVGEMSVASQLLHSTSNKSGADENAAGSGAAPAVSRNISMTKAPAGGRGAGDGARDDKPMDSFQASLAARLAGKKWIGKRRTADVVARTKVECLVLGRKEMQWAITTTKPSGTSWRRTSRIGACRRRRSSR